MNSYAKSSLNYGILEDRNLLAGDVTVVEDGNLYIRGDELSNQFAIVADESGQITVTGRGNTTINGSSEPFRVSESTNLNGARSRNAAFDGGVRIMTYGGHDRIDIQGIEFGDKSRIFTGEGNDFVRFLKSTSQHDFLTVTGAGDDTLNFVQTRVVGDFNVTTSDGHDSIQVRNSRTWGDTHIFSGTGDDSVTLDRVRLTGDGHRVITHDGEDRVVLRNNHVNEAGLDVFAGDGRDHVFAEMGIWNVVEGKVTLAGQGGFDVLEVDVDENMVDAMNHSGFVGGTDVEGSWWAFDREDALPKSSFQHWASAVEFDETTTISSIDWLGSYFGSEGSDVDNFVIEIFENEAIESTTGDFWYTQPVLESVTRFNVGDDANRIDTGVVWNDAPNGPFDFGIEGVDRKIFSYSADINFEFLAEETYWVSIYALVEPGSENPADIGAVTDDDFGVLLDYPGEAGQSFKYVPPTGSQAAPFRNTNAVRYGDNVDLNLAASRWLFNSADIRTIFTLNQ